MQLAFALGACQEVVSFSDVNTHLVAMHLPGRSLMSVDPLSSSHLIPCLQNLQVQERLNVSSFSIIYLSLVHDLWNFPLQSMHTIGLMELANLRLHPLHGKLSGLHSASISMQYRITLELEVHEQEIILVNVGSHRRGVLMNRFASASVKPQPDARTNPLTLEPLPW